MTPVARRALASVALQQMAGAALPELPTAAGLQWRVLTAPTELQQHCPYTAPISAYRGRHLAHRLELALQHDYGHPAGSKRAVDSAIQLRYKLSQAPRTAHGPGAELLLPPLVAQYTAGVAQQHPQHHLELQGNGVQGDGSGVQPQGGAVRHLALDKHLFIEDFDTFAGGHSLARLARKPFSCAANAPAERSPECACVPQLTWRRVTWTCTCATRRW